MVSARRVCVRIETLFYPNRRAHRLDDEFECHLDQQITKNTVAMSPEGAR